LMMASLALILNEELAILAIPVLLIAGMAIMSRVDNPDDAA